MHSAADEKILDKKINIIGIVGKNGKSTIEQIIHHCYLALGNDNKVESPTEFLKKLSTESYEKPAKDVIMEVSICAIKGKKASYIDFDSLIFTNSGKKNTNLDELWTMKRPFIALPRGKTAIINIDDEHAADFCDVTIGKTITYALNQAADVNARNIKLAFNKIEFDLYCKGSFACRIEIPYFGIYNIYNTLAAITYFVSKGYETAKLAQLFPNLPQLPGRFDSFTTKAGVRVVVDYARNSDAIDAVLKSLAAVCRGNIITVIGADANTNATQRATIGKKALAYSKQVIFTTDNPRTEDPQGIIYDIIKGNVRRNYRICLDREKAIESALKMAKSRDVIIIFGKGHEKIQAIGGKTRFFCDKKTALYLVQKFEI